MAGRFFDEWQVGDVITHEIRRTVTETDNLLFSTRRAALPHTSERSGRHTIFGRPGPVI